MSKINDFIAGLPPVDQAIAISRIADWHLCEVCGMPDGFGLSQWHQDCSHNHTKTPVELMRDEWERIRRRVAPQIFERDGRRCMKCHSDKNLTIDHIIPISRGGTNEKQNLRPLCGHCNSSKRDR